MSEINSNTGETSLDDKNCPYFPTLEEIATTRFEMMFPKYDMLVPTEQKEFVFPEPYNPSAQGIMPVQDNLQESTPYELLKAENVDQSRIQLAQNVNEVILQNLETDNNILRTERRRYRRGDGDLNRPRFEDVSKIIVSQRTDDSDELTDDISAREWLLDTPNRRDFLSRSRFSP